MSDARTEFGETRFFKRNTEVCTKDEYTFVQRDSSILEGTESHLEDEEKKPQELDVKRVHSFFQSEHGS